LQPYIFQFQLANFIRDFANLQPQELWPDVTFLPEKYKSIRILTAYRNSHPTLDVYNNVYLDTQDITPLPRKLQSWGVLINGKPAEPEELEEITIRAAQTIGEITDKVSKLKLKDVGLQYAHLFWWRKRELSKAVGRDWRPPESVLARIPSEIPDSASKNSFRENFARQYNFI